MLNCLYTNYNNNSHCICFNHIYGLKYQLTTGVVDLIGEVNTYYRRKLNKKLILKLNCKNNRKKKRQCPSKLALIRRLFFYSCSNLYIFYSCCFSINTLPMLKIQSSQLWVFNIKKQKKIRNR